MNEPWRPIRLHDENKNALPQVWNESKGIWELLTEDSLATQLQKQLIAEQRENARLQTENARMKAALEIYANEDNWSSVMAGEAENIYTTFSGYAPDVWEHDEDPWTFARVALETKEESK